LQIVFLSSHDVFLLMPGGVICVELGVEIGLKCCGVELLCTVERGAGDEFPVRGDPNHDLLIFTIFRCFITSSLAWGIPFCGSSLVALRIFRSFRTSSVARLMFVAAVAEVEGDSAVFVQE